MRIFSILLFTISLSYSSNSFAQEQSTPSAKSQMIYKILKAADVSAKTFDKLLSDPIRGNKSVNAKKINRRLQTTESSVDGFMMLTIQKPTALNKHILVVHGGAYVSEGTNGHRKLMEELALKYNFKVSYIDYPLAPEHHATYSFEILEKAFNLLTLTHPDDVFYLFGDSAGGGMALAFLQTLREKQNPNAPKKTVLQSPWLDVSMSNPAIKPYIEKEVLLDFDGLKECGILYAGELDHKHPLVSPIYGSMENLGKIQVFVSTHELFYPDCMLLEQKITVANGSSIDIDISEGLMHDWIVVPSKERNETIQKIASFLLEE